MTELIQFVRASKITFTSVAIVLAFHASTSKAGEGFTDISKESGVAAAIEAHYLLQPKWWLAGTNLIDLDGDGHLGLFLGGHGQSAAVALNDGHGHFKYVDPSAGKLPPTEIHIACDT